MLGCISDLWYQDNQKLLGHAH